MCHHCGNVNVPGIKPSREGGNSWRMTSGAASIWRRGGGRNRKHDFWQQCTKIYVLTFQNALLQCNRHCMVGETVRLLGLEDQPD